MDKYQELLNTLRMGDIINHLTITDDFKTIINKDLSLTQVVKITGRSFEGLVEEEAKNLREIRIKALSVFDESIFLQSFVDRREVEKQVFQQKFPSPHIKGLYEAELGTEDKDYTTEIYFTITKKFKTDKSLTVSEELIELKKNIEDLTQLTQRFCLFMQNYSPKILEAKEEDKSLLSFLSRRLNYTEENEVSDIKSSLDRILTLTDIEFDESKGLMTLHQKDTKKYGCILRLNALPNKTYQEMLDTILSLRCKFTIFQNVEYLIKEKDENSKTRELASLQSIINTPVFQPFQLETVYSQNVTDLEAAIGLAASNKTKFVNHAFHIFIYADNIEELEIDYKLIKNALGHTGINVLKETENLENAWLSQHIGWERFSAPRTYNVSLHSVANYCSLSAGFEGMHRCAWGDRPVTQFRTLANSKFNFTFHENEEPYSAGSSIIIGKSGTGKTTLAAKLVGNCLTYGKNKHFPNSFKSLIFDAGRGLNTQVRCLGGEYIDLSDPKNLPMNPLFLAENEKDSENVKFLIDWVACLAGGRDVLNDNEISAIDKGIRDILALKDKSERRLSLLTTSITQNVTYRDGDVTLYDRLKKWFYDEELGDDNSLHSAYFNAEKDALNFEKQVVAFDMENLLKGSDEILIPVLMYITHSYQQYIRKNPCPNMLYIDEAHTYLKTAIGSDYINDTILKIRKTGGIVLLVTQTIGHILECPKGKSIAQNIVTKIIFPNTDADEEELQSIGLNESDVDWIINSRESRKALIKKNGMQSTLVDLDFSNYGKYLHMLTGTMQDILLLNKCCNNTESHFDAIEEYLDIKEKQRKDMM
tara:strand:- start:6822 stop:9275 length:2454 start_codon:yes stop_codon:yes gene_type:complete